MALGARRLLTAAVAGCAATACPATPLRVTPGVGAAAPLDFGRVVLGEQAALPLALRDVGAGDLAFLAPPELQGANPGDFSLPAQPPGRIAAGESEGLTVTFAPTALGARAAQAVFRTDSAVAPALEVALSGSAIDPYSLEVSLAPSALDLGDVPLHFQNPQLVYVRNRGIDVAPLQAPQIVGTSAAEFTVAPQGALAPLAPGATLVLTVTFAPQAVGSKTAALQLLPCRQCAPLTTALTGTGLQNALRFDPPSLDFGQLRRGQTATLGAALVNDGLGALSLVALGVADGGRFAVALVDGGLPAPLPSGGRLSAIVRFAPDALEPLGQVDTGALIANVLLEGDPQPAVQAAVSGTAVADCQLAAPAALDFGRVAVDGGSLQTVALRNAGADPCTIADLRLSIGLDAGFSLPERLTAVPALSSAPLAVDFAPQSLDPLLRSDTLTLVPGSPLNPVLTVALRGRGRRPANPAGSPWPRFAHDNGNRSLAAGQSSVAAPVVRWRTYVGHADGGLPPNFGAPFDQAPVLGADDTIYLVGWDNVLRAIDPLDGSVVWALSLSPAGRSQPAVPTFPGLSAVVAADGTIFALSPLVDGSPRLSQVSADGRLLQAATLGGDLAQNLYLRGDGSWYLGYVEILAAYVDLYPATQFQALWSNPVPSIGSAALADDGTLYLSNLQQLADGGQGWAQAGAFDAGGCLVSSLAPQVTLDDQGLLVIGAGGEFIALDPASGAPRWSQCLAQAVAQGPSSASRLRDGGYVTFYGNGGTSQGLQRVDPPGTTAWRYPSADLSPLLPAVGGDGTLFATAQSGPQIVALYPDTGTVRWTLTLADAGPPTSGLAIDSQGALYFVDQAGFLNAVR